ncbi:MAG: hypothetical protein J6W14_02085 [Clostridia bacterium]|nr:hypothetical protein [Clostridia bacterium]
MSRTKFKAKKQVTPAANTNTKHVVSDKLELMITVVNRNKADFFMDLIQSFDVNMQLAVPAQGTANAEIRNILGLAETDKAVIFSVIREDTSTQALNAIEEKFQTIKNAKGIAYTIPLTSVIGVSIYGFLSNNRMTVKGANNQ